MRPYSIRWTPELIDRVRSYKDSLYTNQRILEELQNEYPTLTAHALNKSICRHISRGHRMRGQKVGKNQLGVKR